jgi:hypothetical protein
MRTTAVPHDESRDPDGGAVLIMALAMIIIGALIVLPLLDYAMTVSRAGRVQTNTTANDEAVKAGIHIALADPISLYTVCASAGLQTEQPLATPPGFNVKSACSWVDAQASEDPESLWYSAATTQAGSTLPAGVAEANATYGSSGAAEPTTWWAASSSVQAGDTIWNPDLPAFDNRFQTKYTMPAAYGDCTVYFPGKYTDPLTISGPGKTFFANGIYYFTNTVTFTGNADVVVGDGLVEGCTDTPDAVLYGENAAGDGISLPAVNGGVGGTFIFGGAGRMVINNSVPTSPGKTLSVIFNKRYVQGTEISTASSAGVSIMTVNGLLNGTDIAELHTPTIAVKAPMQTGTTPSPAPGSLFKPSTWVPPDLITPTPAVVDINMTAATQAMVHIPGYVAAPQGIVKVSYAPGMTGGKDVMINGGVLGAQILISPDRPDTDLDPVSKFVIGLENPTVQQTFKITSRTTGAPPLVTATAIVQVNQSGVAWVNSYVVQSN